MMSWSKKKKIETSLQMVIQMMNKKNIEDKQMEVCQENKNHNNKNSIKLKHEIKLMI